jgi:uncharacterized protein YndB with AHSA1/START domain
MIVHNSLRLNPGKEPVSELDRLASPKYEIRFETRIAARARNIFRFFIADGKMKSWLAPVVTADPQPGGVFRLSDGHGSWIEGRYLEIVSHQRVAFTWGGIHGLGIGESIVQFSLLSDASTTLVRLQHYGLSEPAFGMHRLGWRKWGLPRLKAAAEGHLPQGTFLDCIAEAREQFAYSGTLRQL